MYDLVSFVPYQLQKNRLKCFGTSLLKNQMYHKMLYANYKCAEKYSFHITPEVFYKSIITDTKIPRKIKKLIEQYTNKEITIDYIKRKKDISGNWTIKKLYLVVRPKEKI